MTPRQPGTLYGIIGYPLGHSLSPLLHNWGFSQLGLDGMYMAWPLEQEKVADFITAARTLPIRGVSVTIPHKQTVLPLLDRVSDRARRLGAVNTLYWDRDALCGENTDVLGFLAPLRGRSFSEALVLGAGGAARAVLAGLAELGVPRVRLANRTAARARELAAEFGVEPLPWEERAAVGADLIVNASPLGMRGERAGETPLTREGFSGRGLAYDLVYNPLRTRFLAEAESAGWETQDGLGMFVEQGRAQFRLWTGRELPADGARELLRAALGY